MNELALFAGYGGGILGGHLLGRRTVCAVEFDPYAASVLLARQNDGCLPPFPVWDDVRTFDGRPWRGLVDVVSGGFPCQDISAAGRGAGIGGERSGLWSEMARIIGEVQPRYVLVENSPMLTLRGLGTVLGDLAALGFDAEWGCLSAAATGAPHKRDRMWIVADATGDGWQQGRTESTRRQGRSASEQRRSDMANLNRHPAQGLEPESQPSRHGRPAGLHGGTAIFPSWPADPADAPESDVGRVVDGCPARVERLKALGNAQVPRVAAAAFAMLSDH